ncbi:hypothetical protein [Conexibacter sp. DBS9H8]|uniref:hypothetical protein n=1 Tax=Conexibacter sp. DBS9H8 TaxID=2937801 RepID=UPI00200FA68A|nr:hypothetical protein [Conexibacter sp. DBS9H8]
MAVANAAAAATPVSPPPITGTITLLGSSWFTVRTPGRPAGVINALTTAADRITAEDTPYVWGGGHAVAGVPSTGERGGPGYNGHRRGFDCSGAVAAVLAGAGLWPAGAGVPADSGVITELLAQHLIAPGVGTAPDAVTLYDDPGVHIFMNIDGRFFGTSDGAGGGDPRGGAGWLADGAWDASDRAFRPYHFLPAVLGATTTDGNEFTFQLPTDGLFSATRGAPEVSLGDLSVADLAAGERVRVSYTPSGTGAMDLSAIAVLAGGPALPPSGPATPTTPAAPGAGGTGGGAGTSGQGGTGTTGTSGAGSTGAADSASGAAAGTNSAGSGSGSGSASGAVPDTQAGGSALVSATGGSGFGRAVRHHGTRTVRRHRPGRKRAR